MPSATSPAPVASPSPAEAPAARRRRLPAIGVAAYEKLALGVLALAALVGYLVYPTYPNYDSYYSLLWGRELVGLDPLSFTAYRAPTEHPLAIAFGALLTPLGDGADRVMVACAVISFLVLVAGVYALGKTAFTPLVGFAAAALLVSRFDFPFLAARGYIDIPYLAVIMWAAVIEARAPRRHPVVVLTLLAAAGLMRPEAWLLAGLYWLWIVLRADVTWRRRVRLRRAGGDRAARLGRRRLRRHRQPAVLADGDRRAGRGARAQQGRRRRAGRAVRVPHQAREVPGVRRGRGRPRPRRSC